MKNCIKCQTIKPISEFGKRRSNRRKGLDFKGGIYYYCRDCTNRIRREWVETHREFVIKAKRNYYAKHPEYSMWRAAKQRAKKVGVPFTIARSDIVIPHFCPVLGIPLIVAKGRGSTDNSPSLDRVVPKLGYVPGNIAVMSRKANTMKLNGTVEDHRRLLAWMEEQERKFLITRPV